MQRLSPTLRNGLFLLIGIGFGFLLSRAGATDPALISQLLLLENLHLLWVIATAVVVGGLFNLEEKRWQWRSLATGEPLSFPHKPFVRTLIPGAILFGIGWGLTGVCPGTAPAMLGEGQWFVAVILLGIVAGTWLVGFVQHAWHQHQQRRPHGIHPR